jgi:protein-S-isoprenylcysteine O-methyltransferase Ste14
MSRFKKWSEKEYPFVQRILGLIPAGFLFVFLIPYLLAGISPKIDQYFGLPSISVGTLTLLMGVILIMVGLFYALWSIIDQFFRGRGTPLPVMATQELLVTGPFRHCRNPMTFGTILLYLGVSLIVGSISAVIIVVLLTSTLILYIKKIEERELLERFGDPYLEYKNQTPFLIPKISRTTNGDHD